MALEMEIGGGTPYLILKIIRATKILKSTNRAPDFCSFSRRINVIILFLMPINLFLMPINAP